VTDFSGNSPVVDKRVPGDLAARFRLRCAVDRSSGL
jgi:hypothetical protein